MEFLRDVPTGQKFGLVTGDTGTSGVADAQFSSVDCQMVQFQAGRANTGYATYTDSSGSLTQGITLSAGEFSGWIPTTNLNKFFYIMSSTLDTMKYHCVL